MDNKKGNKKKNKNKNKKRNRSYNPLKRGLKIGCINVRGLVSSPTKRIDLYNWIKLHDLDVICIHEWYIHKDNNIKNNKNDYLYLDWNDNFAVKEDEITLNMSVFIDYEKMEINKKTLILYHKDLDIIDLNHIDECKQDGLDSNWIGIKTKKRIMVIGSVYHSPSHDANYSEIKTPKNRITRELKKHKKQVIFSINGDYSSKNTLCGSTKTDSRGEYLLDWSRNTEMIYMNDGKFTHKNSNGKTDVLDLMLMDIKAIHLVHSWKTHSAKSTRIKKLMDGTKKNILFSDHKGMIAIIGMDPIVQNIPDQITWRLNEKKVEKFNQEIEIKMKEWYEICLKNEDDPSAIDLLTELFQLSITNTAKDVFGFKKYNSRSVNWIDEKYQSLLNEKNKIKNKISHIMSKMKKHFRTIIKASKHMKRQLKKFKQKRNNLNKKLNKQKYKNVLKSTKNFEKLINDPNVDKEKLFYEAMDKISNRKTKTIPPIRDPKNDNIIATTNMRCIT